MSFGNTILLSNNARIPQIGLGTWKSMPEEVGNAVEIAVKNGYRHLDFAHIYGNQQEVGETLRKLIPVVIKREELFITSKLWNTSHQPADVAKELDITLKDLGLDYLDLYLVHWPVSFVSDHGLFPLKHNDESQVELDLKTTLIETWKAMIELLKTGKIRAIGVSNFSIEHIKAIVAATGVAPAVNQVEAHPLLPQDELVAYCKEQNIHITAYSPLANNSVGDPMLTEHPTVKQVAKKIGATEAQVLVAWGAYRGYSVIPKSVREDRIISNFKQVELTQEDYNNVSSIKGEKHTRYNVPFLVNKPKWDISIFDEPGEAMASHKPLVG